MNLKFFELINRIEAELCQVYWPGAIRWADEQFDSAWSNAITRFEAALIKALSTANFAFLEMEGKVYKETLLCLMKQYKEVHQINGAKEFLDNLQFNFQ